MFPHVRQPSLPEVADFALSLQEDSDSVSAASALWFVANARTMRPVLHCQVHSLPDHFGRCPGGQLIMRKAQTDGHLIARKVRAQICQ